MKRIQIPNAILIPQICELVNEGHKVSICIKGKSMRPFLEGGRDIVVLAASAEYKKGDVVLAEVRKDMHVLHRIEYIDSRYVRLRGDGNIKNTEICRTDGLRAKAVGFVRKGRSVSTDSIIWRIYSKWWTGLLPLRRILLAAYRTIWLGEWDLLNRYIKRKITRGS